MAIKYITVLEKQSVWDIAVQEYGSSEGVLQLAIDNPEAINFFDSPVPGTKLLIDTTKILNKDVVALLKSKGVKPAHGVEVEIPALLLETGDNLLQETGDLIYLE